MRIFLNTNVIVSGFATRGLGAVDEEHTRLICFQRCYFVVYTDSAYTKKLRSMSF